jgi:uncharacterized protein (TIGR03435 family)
VKNLRKSCVAWVVVLAGVAACVPLSLAGQTVDQAAGGEPAAAVQFDVASIRLSPADAHMMYPPNGSAENFSARMTTVESMIGFAYDIPVTIGMSMDPAHFFLPHPQRLSGEPGWVFTDRYDLTAKLDGPPLEAWTRLTKDAQKAQLRLMMQALLADRFKLTMRHETRQMPVYALVVAKGGPKFAAGAVAPAAVDAGSDAKKPYVSPWKLDRGLIAGQGRTMDGLVEMLGMQRELDSRKILDQTGLKGKYDFSLKWGSVDDPHETDGPSLFTAIQEQMGLKLQPEKTPMDVLVVDHIERPSAN